MLEGERLSGQVPLGYLNPDALKHILLHAEDVVEEIEGYYSIQRWDGVKATICCDRRQFAMVVWHADAN
ncbi:hypothetical protein B9Z55_002704 [Caenorhabditis nigoni]|uniref:Uncharacterized protein n=1 Tax=Caenorhabditis nigoni TaxID=1611254 RepID=A0A2G5VLR7_9PELO|nr:hypothetical protein B9Z55_002704 [Caenorhabditis nigoni]